MRGTVNKAEIAAQGQSDKGPWTRWAVTINGEEFSCFKDPQVSPGDLVDYETVQQGKYTNIKTMRRWSSKGPPVMVCGAVSRQETPQTFTSNGVRRGKSAGDTANIHRAVALKAAVEWGKGQPLDDVMYYADRFYVWLQTGRVTNTADFDKGLSPDEPPPEIYDQDADHYG